MRRSPLQNGLIKLKMDQQRLCKPNNRKKKKMKKNKSLREIWDKIKHTTVSITGIWKERRKKREGKKYWKK